MTIFIYIRNDASDINQRFDQMSIKISEWKWLNGTTHWICDLYLSMYVIFHWTWFRLWIATEQMR